MTELVQVMHEELLDQSMLSMEGLVDRNAVVPSLIPQSVSKCCCKSKITTIACLNEAVCSVFAKCGKYSCKSWPEQKAAIYEILKKIDFGPTELGKYTYFDSKIPYTRNLINTDNENYTLLLLCWSPGMESKIHDHPCQGCFVRTISGNIKETIYRVDQEGEINFVRECLYPEGQTSFMNDSIGLHKIGNPNPEVGAISLHLYCPPYKACKIWPEGTNFKTDAREGRICHYSEYGLRTTDTCHCSADQLAMYI